MPGQRVEKSLDATRTSARAACHANNFSETHHLSWGKRCQPELTPRNSSGGRTRNDLWTVPPENDGAGLRAGKTELFLRTPADERYPVFSPDGRWLAYTSNESGSFQVYVRAFPDKGGKWQISSEGGVYPMWSGTGHDLFFESLDSRIMVASYTVQGDSFLADKPRLWLDQPLANMVDNSKNFDLAADGKRIAAIVPAEGLAAQLAQRHAIFLENFFDELRRKAPLK